MEKSRFLPVLAARVETAAGVTPAVRDYRKACASALK